VVASEQAETPRAANYPASAASGAADETAQVQGSLSAPAQRRAAFAAAAVGGVPSDQAARLRAAAAAGRTSEVVDLLEQGAPVDAPDAAGDTALMKSLQADHPATAAALRRHGASLDHKNHAGESARDLATTKNDPELDRAIGLSP
jgi:ankyrin repeat protein